ncbi:hypothetical protein CB1_000589033 [Camelus ferus]|nr:hypothetical protein CB1_000589033 [Camelus ferus]
MDAGGAQMTSLASRYLPSRSLHSHEKAHEQVPAWSEALSGRTASMMMSYVHTGLPSRGKNRAPEAPLERTRGALIFPSILTAVIALTVSNVRNPLVRGIRASATGCGGAARVGAAHPQRSPGLSPPEALDHSQQALPGQRQRVSGSACERHGLCRRYSARPLQRKASHGCRMSQWAWLGPGTATVTKDSAHWLHGSVWRASSGGGVGETAQKEQHVQIVVIQKGGGHRSDVNGTPWRNVTVLGRATHSGTQNQKSAVSGYKGL